MGKSSIEWTGSTWNPLRARNVVTGKVGTWCQKVSEACRSCYAEAHNARNLPHGSSGLPYSAQGGERAEIFIDPKMLEEPLWRQKPETYFVCSMTDLLLERHSFEMIDQLFAIMALTPQHTYQCLTKRPERAAEYLSAPDRPQRIVDAAFNGAGLDAARGSRLSLLVGEGLSRRIEMDNAGIASWPLPNAWLGTSVEDQANADKRITELQWCPAAVRFLSVEPLLGPIDLRLPGVLKRTKPEGFDALSPARQEEVIAMAARAEYMARCETVDWVIVGGESGHGARPMHPAWARSLRDQCIVAGVPFFFKQWGAWAPMEALGAKSWRRTFWDGTTARGCLRGSDGDLFGGRSFETRYPWEDHEYPCMVNVGKHAAGRLLDGREWNELPEVSR